MNTPLYADKKFQEKFTHNDANAVKAAIAELDGNISNINSLNLWIPKNAVATKAALVTTYPAPAKNWAAMVLADGYVYINDGLGALEANWVNSGQKQFPVDVVIKEELKELNSINYLPEKYATSSKYLSGFGDNYNLRDLFTSVIAEINGKLVNAVSFNSGIGGGSFRYLFEVISDEIEFFKFRGDGKFSFYIKSDANCILSSYLFKNGSDYDGISGVNLIADKWTKIEYDITVNDTVTSLFNRIGTDIIVNLLYALPAITDNYNSGLSEQIDFFKNEDLELDNIIFDSGENLYSGIEFDNVYMNYDDKTHIANMDYGISKKMLVEAGENYTFTNHHSVIAFDKKDRFVYSWTMSDFSNTIKMPVGTHYIRCNVNKSWDSFVINKGNSATNSDFHKDLKNEIRGLLIQNKSITKDKLADELLAYLGNAANLTNSTITYQKLDTNLLNLIENPTLQDGSIILSKLNNSLKNYLANAVNLIDGTISQNKLSSTLLTYLFNAANLANSSITLSKLSPELIQYINSSGGGNINNNSDGVTIKINGLGQLEVDSSAFNIIISKSGESTEAIISRISAISGKVILVIKEDIVIDNSFTTFPDNLYKVIGIGGKLTPNGVVTTYRYLTFPQETIFECGNYQLFDKFVIAKCLSGYLGGTALPKWWGAAIDGVTNDQIAIDAFLGSNFKHLRFTKGIYVAYPGNSIDGRTFIMDEGSIIDGVFHVGYGSDAGASEKVWCKNTTFIGQLVSTVRVGGAQIDGLSMPSGIKILGVNDQYVNQSLEGTCKGIHWHFGCKNLNIGDCIIEAINPIYNEGSLIMSYGLGIDGYEGEEYPHDIYIKSIKIGYNTSNYYDIYLYNSKNIKIDDVICLGSSNQVRSLESQYCENIHFGNYVSNCNNPSGYSIYIALSKYISFEKLIINSTIGNGSWGLFLDDTDNVNILNLNTLNQTQGARISNSNQVTIMQHKSENCPQAIAQSGSTYNILSSFLL